MAKTQEELNSLKTEYETVTNKLQEISQDELGYVTGGIGAEEHNIFLASDITGNKANGNGAGGGVYNEGSF